MNSVLCGHQLLLPEVQLGVRGQLPNWLQVVKKKLPQVWPLPIFTFTLPQADSTSVVVIHSPVP